MSGDMRVSVHQARAGYFHASRRTSSFSWKAVALLGLAITGTPSVEARCNGLFQLTKVTLTQASEWLFPSLKRAITPLDTLLDKIGRICPVQDMCLDRNEIEEQAARVNAVMFFANNVNPLYTVHWIEEFGIKHQPSIMNIYASSVEKSDLALFRVLSRIKNCEIPNESDRIRLALSGAKGDDWVGDTLKRFKEFDIFQSEGADQSGLIAFVEECIKINSKTVASHFRVFGIKDEASRLRLAKMCAQIDGEDTASNFLNFEITDPKGRQDVAELCFQQNPVGAAYHVYLFEIEDQPTLERYVEFCFERGESGQYVASNIAKIIHRFHLQDPNKREKFARFCLFYAPFEAAEHFRNFRIEEESVRESLLSFGIEQSAYNIARFYRNFAIISPRLIVEHAKTIAMSSGKGIAEYFYSFDIVNEDDIEDIAISAFQQDAAGTSRFFNNFNFKDPSRRVKLAKFSATKDGLATVKNIEKFNIPEQSDREAIFAIAVQNNPQANEYAHKFGVTL